MKQTSRLDQRSTFAVRDDDAQVKIMQHEPHRESKLAVVVALYDSLNILGAMPQLWLIRIHGIRGNSRLNGIPLYFCYRVWDGVIGQQLGSYL